MRDAVIVDAVRTPIGRRRGALAALHPVDLSARVLTALVGRTGLDPKLVDDVMWGCVNQLGDQSSNVARMAVLAAGWPESVPGTVVERACGSSQQALHFAAATVMSGMADIVIAGGVEMMSRVPLGAARSTGEPYGPAVLARYGCDGFSQGAGAETLAQRYRLTRAALDGFAVRSHELAAAAVDRGDLDDQLVAVPGDGGPPLRTDEGIRRGTTVERLAALPPAFREDGVIHAGNSSQISDGAAGLLVMSGERARELGLAPMARFHSGSVVGADPVLMLGAPWPATHAVLARAGLTVDEVGAFEINEAFAPVPMAWLAETGADPDRVNPLGGAIAVGHPLGASGAVLMTRLLHHMRRHDLRFGLQSMCEAGGMANATVVELVR